MSTIGERLKEERLRKQLSQEKFGEFGGVQKVAQINYESGRRTPDATYLERLAAHDVDVVYVITGERLPPDQVRTYAMFDAAFIDQANVDGTPEQIRELKNVAFMELAKRSPTARELLLISNYRQLDEEAQKMAFAFVSRLVGTRADKK